MTNLMQNGLLQFRWIALASVLFTTACMDEECGITSPTGSHDDGAANLTVELIFGRSDGAAAVVFVGSGEYRFAAGERTKTITVNNVRPDQFVRVSVQGLPPFSDYDGCKWDGKLRLQDPEILIETQSGQYKADCYNWIKYGNSRQP